MNNSKNLELFVFIVNYNEGSRVMKIAKQSGVRGTTAFLGHGTVDSSLLAFLGLTDVRKELVMMVTDKEIGTHALEEIAHALRLDKQGKGIAFTMDVTRMVGTRGDFNIDPNENRGEESMYEAIFVVVDKGRGEYVIEAAKLAGSKGATLINARGSGIHERSKLFAMDIEPEREIILILSERKNTDKIISVIAEENKMSQPGNGILFTCDVTRTLGLYENKDDKQ